MMSEEEEEINTLTCVELESNGIPKRRRDNNAAMSDYIYMPLKIRVKAKKSMGLSSPF